jgi:hypothetical protein
MQNEARLLETAAIVWMMFGALPAVDRAAIL